MLYNKIMLCVEPYWTIFSLAVHVHRYPNIVRMSIQLIVSIDSMLLRYATREVWHMLSASLKRKTIKFHAFILQFVYNTL